MDPTIQSQIKSPLVRTLQSIPTNSANYVHGIPDNTPPFSKHQVRLNPSSGDSSNLSGLFVFKIPQNGRLNNMYLKYKMLGTKHNVLTGVVMTQDTDNVFSFANGIEYVELRTHNQTIERIYAEAIPFEIASLAKSEVGYKRTLQGCAGYMATNDTSSELFEPSIMNEPSYQGGVDQMSNDRRHVAHDYLIQIPLSSTYYLKDNLQTRMMEDLELVVKTKLASSQFVPDPHASQLPRVNQHELQLMVDYINFHENVEEVIRNENFKPDIPAVLLQNDYLKFRANYSRTDSEAAPRVSIATYEAKISSDALVTDLYIVPKMRTAGYEYEQPVSLRNLSLHFELKSGSGEILSGFKYEYDGVESRQYSTVTRQHQNEGVLPLRWSPNGTHIRLSLNHTDEYFDGGLSLQSLVEPILTVRVYYDNQAPPPIWIDVGGNDVTNFNDNPQYVAFDVVVKRKVMLRIDGNTGKFAKSLES